MMEILSEAPATIEQSMITENSIVDELREMLPQMNADLVTLKVVMENLAIRFGMKFADLKAQWRLQIKALLPEMLDLCDGGVGECNNHADKEGENEDEEADVRPSRQRYRKKRIAVVDASDEEEIDEGSNVDEDDEAGPKGDKSPDATALVERSPEMKRPKKRKSKERFPSAKKIKAVTQLDPPGLGSLKELGRAAGVLNPQVYKLLKRAESTKEAEEILRERLHDAGITFHGSYPSSRDISAARKKHAKEKELEGIDTNLIISAGRSRRGGRQLISYKENRIGSDLDDDDVDQYDDVNEDAGNSSENESAISGSDSSEASF